MSVGENIRKAIPWIDPVLDCFDWRKRIVAAVTTLAIFLWSFVSGLPWPAIFTLAFTMLVMTAYALVFPALLTLVNVGIRERPSHSIWKTKKRYTLHQGASLLADTVDPMSPDAQAWFFQLRDAVQDGEIHRVESHIEDDAHTLWNKGNPIYIPHSGTEVTREELKKFCAARGRYPEFLSD